MTDSMHQNSDFQDRAVSEMIRVNHAGEYGARQIYRGQLAVLGADECASTLRHMAQQEEAHLASFEEFMRQKHVRPSALLPFWHAAGYALGAATALMGKRAAMACTVAVESVISEHYQQQIEQLGEQEPALKQAIVTFRHEELEHRAIGLEQEAEKAPFYEVLSGAIRGGCRAAIWLAKRV